MAIIDAMMIGTDEELAVAVRQHPDTARKVVKSMRHGASQHKHPERTRYARWARRVQQALDQLGGDAPAEGGPTWRGPGAVGRAAA